MLRRAMVALMTLLVLATTGASWTAVVLLEQAATQRAEQAERAEARSEQVRDDVAELLDEVRDPAEDTRRSSLYERARRIEDKVDQLLDRQQGDG